MRILLLSAYDADSHKYWRNSLVDQYPEHSWTCLTLPSRYFSWRIRGNSLSWGFGDDSEKLKQEYDLIIATSMSDLSSLRGFIPSLTRIPTLLYFHENQFAYPNSDKAFKSIEPQILNLYSALSADFIAFNSEYNRSTFLHGAEALLKKMPDQVPAEITQLLSCKSTVLEVPLLGDCYQEHSHSAGPLQVIWNHRWEYDKGPDKLLNAMSSILHNDATIQFHIVGQQFRRVPEAFTQIRKQFSDSILSWGYIESYSEYRNLLRQSDVVLSTADHDYQGIAVLEGVASGARPVVPNRLAYKELFTDQYRYDEQNETQALTNMILKLAVKKRAGEALDVPDITRLSWQNCKPRYSKAFEETVTRFQESYT